MKSPFAYSLLALGSAAALLVAACSTGPVYRPRGPGDVVGYTDQQITQNRFRVTFSGNYATRRPDVEDFLMRRAAEVTLQNGYSHFVFDDRDTQAQTYYRVDVDPFDRYPYWARGRRWYWSSFDFDRSYDARPVTRYEAYAEIIALTPEQARNNPEAIPAQDVLNRLAPPPPPVPPTPPPPPRNP